MATTQTTPDERLLRIEQARAAVMFEGRSATDSMVDAWFNHSWIERSWRRCMARGRRPDEHLAFDVLPAQAARRATDAGHELVQVARPVLDQLSRAIASTRYFAILTDANGIVVDVGGSIDRSDARAHLITRIGVDLSEAAVGTTAIGAALAEHQPVWLHRGEHFFRDTSVYSCAGAPFFGPDGHCAGMLDLTGVETIERPELKHLAAQAARSIENALAMARPHALLLRLNWPGHAIGDDTDGLIALDGDGCVVGANPAARQMVSVLTEPRPGRLHCSELFAMPMEMLFDSAGLEHPLEVPLWSGLRLQVLSCAPGQPVQGRQSTRAMPLRDVEAALIRKAVDEARGNVMQAARALGISRATVYRKLGKK
ncbi:MAG: helix-turn-helix domain-containing protein [Pseudomonadota bacterium]